MAIKTDTKSDYLGRIIGPNGTPVGTCFQISPGILVTAYHVVNDIRSGYVGAVTKFGPLEGSDFATARIQKIDTNNDLAIMHTDQPLQGCVSHLAYSDIQKLRTQFYLTGFATLPGIGGPAEHDYLSTVGIWEGVSRRSDGIVLGVGNADGVARGMSGCPIMRSSDNAVIGVLSSRYNTADGWSSGRIWISRIEDLDTLITGVVEVPIERSEGLVPTDQSKWLAETPIDRSYLLQDKYFINPPQWSKLWKDAEAKVKTGAVLIIAARPGVGSTTFAEQLLARTTPESMELVRLDPGDWEEPLIKAIPQRHQRAYVLDLRDPEHDLPNRSFIRDLSKLASIYRNNQSRLVITIADDMWRGNVSGSATDIHTVYLNKPPDPQEIVERYISVKDSRLEPVARSSEVTKHLNGMNAVQAQHAAETILHAGASAREANEDDLEALIQRVIELLDNHLDTLDSMFGDPSSHSRKLEPDDSNWREPISPLMLEDRCLLVTLAYEKTSHLDRLEKDSQRLINKLQSGRAKNAKEDKILAGPGIRGRLKCIGADIGASEIVSLLHPSLGDAAIRYVWDYYTPVRKSLASWMIDLAADGRVKSDTAIEWLSELVRRSQDIDFVKNTLVKLALDRGQVALLTNIIADTAEDVHTRRRCERLLYDWAEIPDRQQIVIAVCRRLISADRKDIALRRLRRAGDSSRTTSDNRDAIFDVFRYAAQNPELQNWFLNNLQQWIRAGSDATSTKLAFTAAMNIEVSGVPWLLSSGVEQGAVDRIFGDLIADLTSIQSADDAIIELIYKASADDELYNRAIDLLAAAAVVHGAIRPILSLSARLSELGRRIGRDPLGDINSKIQLVRVQEYPSTPDNSQAII